MAEDPENLALVFLRRIDAKIDGLTLDVRELKERTSAVELGLTSVRRDIAALAETDARLQVSLDRMRDDVGRIQRRLDLHDEPAA
jgi:outer membrane murein-binding lipoprotein Lpp